VELLLAALSVLAGGVPGVVWVGVLVLICVAAFRRAPANGESSWTRGKLTVAALLLAVSQVVMFAVMIVRHPPLYDIPDHRLWYYPLPFQALAIALVVPLIGRSVSGPGRWRAALVNTVLAGLVVANVAQWNPYRGLQASSTWFATVYHHSRALKLSLADGRPYTSHAGYSRFYRYCLTLSPPFRQKAEQSGFLSGSGDAERP
jgi:hypothetical protein